MKAKTMLKRRRWRSSSRGRVEMREIMVARTLSLSMIGQSLRLTMCEMPLRMVVD